MRLTDAISKAPRLLPAPAARPAAPDLTQEPVRPAAPANPAEAGAPRSTALWLIARETAAAAIAAQMLAAPRRGLKAEPAERARFIRAYRRKPALPTGLEVSDVA